MITPDKIRERMNSIWGFQGGGIGLEKEEQLELACDLYMEVIKEIYFHPEKAEELTKAVIYS